MCLPAEITLEGPRRGGRAEFSSRQCRHSDSSWQQLGHGCRVPLPGSCKHTDQTYSLSKESALIPDSITVSVPLGKRIPSQVVESPTASRGRVDCRQVPATSFPVHSPERNISAGNAGHGEYSSPEDTASFSDQSTDQKRGADTVGLRGDSPQTSDAPSNSILDGLDSG